MKQKIYQVDAFADKVFSGNPAAICPLEQWLSDELLQKIAMENNLAETAFYVKAGDQYQIRWFTPTVEVDLCGHATLASAFVLFNFENYKGTTVRFHSPRSGSLTVSKNGELLTLNFPTDKIIEVELSKELMEGFNSKPLQAFKGKTDYMLVFDGEKEIRNMIPELDKIAKLKARGVIATAKGENSDFVCRFFAPQSGINEDPVTGSAYTSLAPYWAKQLGKTEMTSVQLSERKGYIQCNHLGDRVEISGQAKLYMIGEIYLQ